MPCSVCFNDITGDGAEALAKVVLESASLTDFCSIPLVSLRENSVTELDLKGKGALRARRAGRDQRAQLFQHCYDANGRCRIAGRGKGAPVGTLASVPRAVAHLHQAMPARFP